MPRPRALGMGPLSLRGKEGARELYPLLGPPQRVGIAARVKGKHLFDGGKFALPLNSLALRGCAPSFAVELRTNVYGGVNGSLRHVGTRDHGLPTVGALDTWLLALVVPP